MAKKTPVEIAEAAAAKEAAEAEKAAAKAAERAQTAQDTAERVGLGKDTLDALRAATEDAGEPDKELQRLGQQHLLKYLIFYELVLMLLCEPHQLFVEEDLAMEF